MIKNLSKLRCSLALCGESCSRYFSGPVINKRLINTWPLSFSDRWEGAGKWGVWGLAGISAPLCLWEQRVVLVSGSISDEHGRYSSFLFPACLSVWRPDVIYPEIISYEDVSNITVSGKQGSCCSSAPYILTVTHSFAQRYEIAFRKTCN